MPVRKIPKNYLSVTGGFSSKKNGRNLGCESILENDLMTLLEFDDSVVGFEEQPVIISFSDVSKRKKRYVPDILIHYAPSINGDLRRPVLGEVKHTSDLKKNKAMYAPKFAAAKLFAEERGWEWRIFTEKDIRTPLLDNLKFLREYHSAEPDELLLQEIIAYLQDTGGSVTVGKLLHDLCPSDARTLVVAPAIWHLIATKRIYANLQKLLAVNTKISIPKGVGS
jgi:hypothetical protein